MIDPATQEWLVNIGIGIATIVSSIFAGAQAGKRQASRQVEEPETPVMQLVHNRISELRAEMITRSHEMADKMQQKNMLDVVEMTKIKGDLERCKIDIAKIDAETASEVRRLEQMIKGNHTDLKTDLKEITDKLNNLMMRRSTDQQKGE